MGCALYAVSLAITSSTLIAALAAEHRWRDLMSKTLKQTRAGRLVCAVVYTTPTAGEAARARAQKLRASAAAREKLNARTSFQKLERVLAANFDTGDLFVTLTYDDQHLPDCRDAAVRRMRSFLSRFRALRRSRGEETRYVYITEGCYPGGRLHHHMVLNSTGQDVEDLRKAWRCGQDVEVIRLTIDRAHSYEDLASYLTKEPREWGHPQVGERTWTPSLGLARTEPETETVPDYVTLTAPPEAVILQNEGPVRNGYGEFAWIKYMLPYQPDRRRARSKRRRRRKKE